MKHAAIAVVLASFVSLTLSGPVLARSSQRVASRPLAVVAPGSARTVMRGMTGDPYKGFTKTGNAVRQSLRRFAATCGRAATGVNSSEEVSMDYSDGATHRPDRVPAFLRA